MGNLRVTAYREQGFPATIVRPSHTYDKTLVPLKGDGEVGGGWRAVIPFEQGAREIVQWYLADPARQVTDTSLDAVMDKLAAAWTV